MSEKLFTVYKSSAGSGKTYTLTRDYLIIALRKPDKFKRILAVTFTNKATQEMKDRIIDTLSNFSQGKLDDMAQSIIKALDITERELISRSSFLLSNILHNYSRFSIQTIDTFFQSVMRSFSRELGLHGDGELQIDSTEAREQVVDLLLEDLTENDQLRKWLLDFSSDKLENAKSWDVRKDILDFSKQLSYEDFLSIEKRLLEAVKVGDTIVDYKDQLQQIKSSFEKSMQKLAKEGLKFLEEKGLEIDDFAYNTAGPAGYFHKVSKGDDYSPGKRVIKAINDEGNSLSTQKSPKREVILSYAPTIVEHLSNLESYYQKKYILYCSAEAILKNIYSLGILWLYQKKLVEYKQEEGILFISDATLFLQRIIGTEETPFIYEKMGAFYDHFLMDEFQDTSAFQWNNFRPLVNNSLDQGYENLVVGDVKQSIYRWRGGDWRLLLSQLREDVRSHAYTEDKLAQNFRSAPNVIDFNNELFKVLPGILRSSIEAELGEEVNNEVDEMLNSIEKAYEDVEQKQKDSYDFSGHISIKFFEKDTDTEESWKEKSMLKLAKDIEMLQDAKIELSDMSILVRGKKEGKEITDFLMQYQKEKSSTDYRYDVISNESLFLASSEAVIFLLNCFKYLYATKNRIALAQLIHYYHTTILKDSISEDELFLSCHKNEQEETVAALLPSEFIAIQKDLLNMNLLDLSEQIIQLFSLGTQQKEIPYLQAFQDVLLEYGNKGNIQDFLDWWDTNQDSYAVKIPESVNAIRLMTIHKSKGLQFKVVFVPFLDWSVNHGGKGPLMWLKSGKEDLPDGVPFVPVKHTKALRESFFKDEYWVEEIKSYLDNLNLAYVAFTRAEQALFAGAQVGTKSSQFAHFIEQALSLKEDWDEEEQEYRVGKLSDISPSSSDETHIKRSIFLESYPSSDWRNKLEVKKGRAIKLSVQKELRNKKINLGLIVHDVFSKMKRLDDQAKVMRELWTERGLSDEELDQVDKLVTENINKHKQLRAWFETDLEVRTEVAIIDPLGKDMRLDRVHLKEDQAEVIDFKTGKEKAADKEQMMQYKAALSAMGYQKVTAKLAYLEPFRIVEV